MSSTGPESDDAPDLAAVAATLRHLLDEVVGGTLVAGPGLLARLEGATLAVEALAQENGAGREALRLRHGGQP